LLRADEEFGAGCNAPADRDELTVMNRIGARAAAPRFDAFDHATAAGRLAMAAIFLLSGWAAAVLAVFTPDAASIFQFNHFFKYVATSGVLLQAIAFGPGRFSIDGAE
jgi:uncharacterized membrane protein YphA (DoxX/SURF4 family)